MPSGSIKIEVIPGRGTIFTCLYRACGSQAHDFGEIMGHVHVAHLPKAEADKVNMDEVARTARLIEPSVG